MEWAQVLVIILAIAFAVFLALAIILVSLLIKISKQIKSITSTAEKTALNFGSTMENVSLATSPAFLVKTIKAFIKNKK